MYNWHERFESLGLHIETDFYATRDSLASAILTYKGVEVIFDFDIRRAQDPRSVLLDFFRQLRHCQDSTGQHEKWVDKYGPNGTASSPWWPNDPYGTYEHFDQIRSIGRILMPHLELWQIVHDLAALPQFIHECKDCTFLGQYKAPSYTEELRLFDLYSCSSSMIHSEPYTIVARCGSVADQYRSLPASAEEGYEFERNCSSDNALREGFDRVRKYDQQYQDYVDAYWADQAAWDARLRELRFQAQWP